MAAKLQSSLPSDFGYEDITLYYQSVILKFLAWILTPVYLMRGAMAVHAGQDQAAVWLLGLALLLAVMPLLPKGKRDYMFLGFISAVLLLGAEAQLSILQGKHYYLYLFLIPLAVIYCSFMSGIIYGTFVAIFAAFYVRLIADSSATQGSLSASEPSIPNFFLYLLSAQLLIFVILFLFQYVLDKGEEEVNARRILRAKTAQRAALGEVLGKLAHEVNNPLAILHAAFQRYQQNLGDLRPSKPELQKLEAYMQEGEDRIQNVLDNLHAFTEGDWVEPMQTIAVYELFRQLTQAFYENMKSRGAQLETIDVPPDLSIRGRPKQVLFILSIFLDNALEAMREEPRRVVLRGVSTARAYRFEVEDNGVGIPDEIVGQIFHPFVSTKPFGQSMGMNLSICYGLAQEQGGHVGFLRKTSGTIFWLELAKAPGAFQE